MERIGVIDTETNWYDQVMSIGVVAADSSSLRPAEGKYYILTPESFSEGMYSDRMDLADPSETMVCSRRDAMADLREWLKAQEIQKLFAYNARFDCQHLPELRDFSWYDIMKIAAYRQHNSSIPEWAECCTTGRLKRNYGVEPILSCLRRQPGYRETHNALLDARDELQIMELLKRPLSLYESCARV